MSINDRLMTLHRARSRAALRVAVSGRQAAAIGLNRQPASGEPWFTHRANHNHLTAGHDDVACLNRISRPFP